MKDRKFSKDDILKAFRLWDAEHFRKPKVQQIGNYTPTKQAEILIEYLEKLSDS